LKKKNKLLTENISLKEDRQKLISENCSLKDDKQQLMDQVTYYKSIHLNKDSDNSIISQVTTQSITKITTPINKENISNINMDIEFNKELNDIIEKFSPDDNNDNNNNNDNDDNDYSTPNIVTTIESYVKEVTRKIIAIKLKYNGVSDYNLIRYLKGINISNADHAKKNKLHSIKVGFYSNSTIDIALLMKFVGSVKYNISNKLGFLQNGPIGNPLIVIPKNNGKDGGDNNLWFSTVIGNNTYYTRNYIDNTITYQLNGVSQLIDLKAKQANNVNNINNSNNTRKTTNIRKTSKSNNTTKTTNASNITNSISTNNTNNNNNIDDIIY